MTLLKKLLIKIKRVIKNFIKNHIIDEVHPDDLDF